MVKKNDKELGMQKLERISQDLHSFYVIVFETDIYMYYRII
jgi:hypothetical protein